MFTLCSLIRRISEVYKVQKSSVLAHLPLHQTFINNIVLFSKEISSSWQIALCAWFPPLNIFPTYFGSSVFSVSSLTSKACWLQRATYKKNHSSLQWLERWIPPRSLFLSPKPFLSAFFLPVHLLLQQVPDFLIVQFQYHVPWCPYVHSCFCHIMHSDSWFRKCGHHKMTFLNYP